MKTNQVQGQSADMFVCEWAATINSQHVELTDNSSEAERWTSALSRTGKPKYATETNQLLALPPASFWRKHIQPFRKDGSKVSVSFFILVIVIPE